MFNNQNNQNNPNNQNNQNNPNNPNNRHFNGNWNPDNNVGGNHSSHPHNNVGGNHSSPPHNMANALPTVIDSDLSIYVLGGLVAYSVYTKYFQKKDYDGDGTKEGCPVSTDALNFDR